MRLNVDVLRTHYCYLWYSLAYSFESCSYERAQKASSTFIHATRFRSRGTPTKPLLSLVNNCDDFKWQHESYCEQWHSPKSRGNADHTKA